MCPYSHPEDVEVEIHKVDESELDEMWSFVKRKEQQRWLWHAIDHQKGVVLAYVCAAPMRMTYSYSCRRCYDHLVSHDFTPITPACMNGISVWRPMKLGSSTHKRSSASILPYGPASSD